MKKRNNSVSGVQAPAPRPTPLGAALVAVIMTFPVAVTILFVDLLLL
ncbi:hypothetical protein [Roseobacter sp. CCS2]|nr:hypothetical protein [Roseobacter sp. CCS2]EBA11735.1 hypothetical protein RCCS2_17441 [Roseobacter sp. CCS2]